MLRLIKKTYTFLTVLSLLLTLSCAEAIDFDQVDELRLSPVIESSLIFLNEPANQFQINGVDIEFIQDSVDITFFDDAFIEENLVKTEFVFETNNSIHRGFQVEVDFLDASDQLVHELVLEATASPDNVHVMENHVETFEGETLAALKATRKMIFTLSVLPGASINENTIGRIQLRSKGIFYLNIEKDI